MLSDHDFEILKTRIHKVLGINLGYYKPQQMHRRLSGYLARMNMDVGELCATIARDSVQAQKLREFITINVSEFFRDPAQFKLLEQQALPELLKSSERLKVWSAGCSHGGEPYSLAILINELSHARGHEVIGTDIDRGILQRAREGGPYSESDVRAVEPGLLARYFVREEDGYRVSPRLRGMVTFKEQNLLEDRFSPGCDLIVCRNVVIYFSDEAKLELNRKFHSALKPNGILFVGGTESLLGAEDLGFRRVRSSLYQKVTGTSAFRTAA